MRIVNIQINEFGPLVDKSFDFDNALTIINGDNESGKSSLLLFIKFALYGLVKRAKSGEVSELERALSHSTGNASGSMTVSHNGKLYRIDRQIRKSGKSYPERVALTDLESGAACDYGSSVGEFLLGIPSEVFDNTCGISQLGCSTVKGEQISTAIRNLLSSADETIDTDKALKSLDAIRVKYLYKNKKGGLIYNLSAREAELSSKYAKAVEDSCETERLEADIKKLDEMIADVSAKQRIADELFSKINLRSVIKLFDKLHEFEADKKKAEARLDEINKATEKNGLLLDRAFVASLTSAKNELEIAYRDTNAKKASLNDLKAPNSTDTALADKVASLGGLDVIRSFFDKTTRSVRTNTTLAVVFLFLAVLSAAISFLPLFVFGSSPIFTLIPAIPSLLLFVLFICLRGRSTKSLKKKCNELDIEPKDIREFIIRAENAVAQSAEYDELTEEIKAVIGIKERILSSSSEKVDAILKKYGFDVNGLSISELISKANDTVNDTTALCDEKDLLSGKLSALSSKISEISTELSDYNEHKTRHRVSPEILGMSDEEIRTAKKEREYYVLQLKALGEKRRSAEHSLMERKYSTSDPFDIASKLAETSNELEAHTKHLEALETAIEALGVASAKLTNTVAPRIRATANGYMDTITDGKYNSVTVSDTLDLSMSEDGFPYVIDTFSTGTKDAAYLSLRLSLLALLGDGEAPPLLMDETLAMIDDKRAAKLLHMLAEHARNNGQCILFSCHDREERLCKAENIPFAAVRM